MPGDVVGYTGFARAVRAFILGGGLEMEGLQREREKCNAACEAVRMSRVRRMEHEIECTIRLEADIGHEVMSCID
jgi:hypothetical protein